MVKLSEEIGEYMNILEPFINLCNGELESVLIPLVFFVIFCDYPKANSHYTFTIIRSGRKNWIWGNILFACSVAAAYIGGIFLLSVVVCQKQCFFYNGWSMYTRKMKYYYKEELLNYGEDKVIDAGLYTHYRPYEAFALTVLLNILLALAIAAVFLLCNVLQLRNAGMLLNMLLILAGWIANLFQNTIMWAFPYANSKLGWHNKYILEETVVSDGYSLAYFVIVLLVLFYVLFRVIRKTPIYVSDSV